MPLFKKKPITIEAFEMTKERRLDNSEWPNWLNQAWQLGVTDVGSVFPCNDGCLEGETHTPLFIHTLEGNMKIEWGDWVIKGVKGELYPCKPDIFEATYDRE